MASAPKTDGPAATALNSLPAAGEQTRARNPDETGFVERGGVQVFYEVYGNGEPVFLLLATWAIVHARVWKAQVPFLARHGRVITFDPRGNGRSDRPPDLAAYDEREYAVDAVAIFDALGCESAIVVCLSQGSKRATILAAEHPDRVRGLVYIGPSAPIGRPDPRRAAESIDFEEERDAYDGWALFNRHAWRRDYRRFLEFFFDQMLPEPHSTKQHEDLVGWGLDTDPETLIATVEAGEPDVDEFVALARRITCPSMVVVGTEDHITGPDRGVQLARLLGSRLEVIEGSGHVPQARQPVRVNLLLLDFARRLGDDESVQHDG